MNPVAIADQILELRRRLESVPEDSPAGQAIRAEIEELRASMIVPVDDPQDLRRRLSALRTEAERIRNQRINLYRQVGGDASGGASRDAAVTVGLNKKMDAAAGLADVESEIRRLERLLGESDAQ
jgi:hypothetical protein